MGAAGARWRGPDGGAATPGFLTRQRAERKRGREGRRATFFFLYSIKVIFETGGGRREAETSDGGLVTSLGPPQPPPPAAKQPPKLPTLAFPAPGGEEMRDPCSTFYSATERKCVAGAWRPTPANPEIAPLWRKQIQSRRGREKGQGADPETRKRGRSWRNPLVNK